jgi:nicotinamide-nucleotide amidase
MGGGAVILSRTLRTFGLGESAVAEKLGELMKRGRNPSVGTTISGGVVSVRINASFGSEPEARRQLHETERACRDALGNLVFGADEETLQQAVARLLVEQKKVLSTAESCTGGLLAKMLTDVPGSSAYYQRGWITYANEAKQDLLLVEPELIAEHGAVSERVVSMMALGALSLYKSESDYGVAISGIAGPTGGTPQKPVGTVCIAVAWARPDSSPETFGPDEVVARTFNFSGDREMIRDRSAKMALTMLRYRLMGRELPF